MSPIPFRLFLWLVRQRLPHLRVLPAGGGGAPAIQKVRRLRPRVKKTVSVENGLVTFVARLMIALCLDFQDIPGSCRKNVAM